jgi:dephospho-CoA kinase
VAIIDAALLAEGGERAPWLDRLVLVLAPVALRIRRLVSERGFSEEEARARIEAQTPPEWKKPLADWVIVNDGPLSELHRIVDAIAEELRDAG